MDEFYIAALENLERQENAVNYRKLSHSERFDAFLLPDYIFIKNYRLTKDLVRYVINILTPHMTEATRTSALNIQTKVSTYLINNDPYKYYCYLLIYFILGINSFEFLCNWFLPTSRWEQ